MEAPVYVAQPPGDRRLFVVSQPGDDPRSSTAASCVPTPFLDLRSSVSGGERGLLSVAFHPRFATNGKLYVDFTDNRGDTRICELHGRRGDLDRVDPGAPRAPARSSSRTRTTTAASCSSAPTATCTSAWATAARAATRTRNGQNLGRAARQDPAHRRRPPHRLAAVRDPAGQPVRQHAGRAGRDLRVRPAQPVAVLVRPADRRPVHRRRRPERLRGGRRRCRRAARAARTSAGTPSRATRSTSAT